jgi:hypothetical protein
LVHAFNAAWQNGWLHEALVSIGEEDKQHLERVEVDRANSPVGACVQAFAETSPINEG